jgi:hypothetical protein
LFSSNTALQLILILDSQFEFQILIEK